DPDSTVKLVQDMLKDWKSGVKYERIARTAHTDVKGELVSIKTPDKEGAVYAAGLVLPMTDSDPDYPALDVANFLVGAAPLASRLSDRVRKKDGLAYEVGSQFSADARDKAAEFAVLATCNPENMKKVEKAVAEELEKVLKDGLQADELAEGKKAYLQQLKGAFAEDGALVSILGSELQNGRTLAFYVELEKKVEALAPE